MPAIDVDPEVLRTVAAASAHAAEQAVWHIDEEIKAASGDMQPLYDTLVAEGPYAYMVLPQPQPDGTILLPRITTREEIVACYEMIRGWSDLLQVIGLTEVRGSWYLFNDNISRGRARGDTSAPISTHETLGLFPSGKDGGITGELVWMRVPRASLGAPDEIDAIPDDPLAAREAVYDQYARFLDGMRANDVDAVMEPLHDLVASTTRDYVDDTGTITDLSGKDVHRRYYEAYFARYDVRSVDVLTQVTEDWYVFAELRITVAPRTGGDVVAYNTAEFWVPSRDGRFIARIGHGTEQA
jgi:hypothetical protein